MTTSVELRHLIESGFAPLSCCCTVNPDGSLMIKVFEPASGRIELLVTAISTENLTTPQAVECLLAELRSEMATRTSSFV